MTNAVTTNLLQHTLFVILAACWSMQSGAATFDECIEITKNNYISRCDMSVGNCKAGRCSTNVHCEPMNRRCVNLFSASNFQSSKDIQYCSSVVQTFIGDSADDVAVKMCGREFSDAQRDNALSKYESAENKQISEEVALFKEMVGIYGMVSENYSRQTPMPRKTRFGRSDKIKAICYGQANLFISQANEDLEASMKGRGAISQNTMLNLKALKSGKRHICACAGRRAENMFSNEEYLEATSSPKPWGKITQDRLREVFGPCLENRNVLPQEPMWLEWLTAPGSKN
jgi:hypothetical protein